MKNIIGKILMFLALIVCVIVMFPTMLSTKVNLNDILLFSAVILLLFIWGILSIVSLLKS